MYLLGIHASQFKKKHANLYIRSLILITRLRTKNQPLPALAAKSAATRRLEGSCSLSISVARPSRRCAMCKLQISCSAAGGAAVARRAEPELIKTLRTIHRGLFSTSKVVAVGRRISQCASRPYIRYEIPPHSHTHTHTSTSLIEKPCAE